MGRLCKCAIMKTSKFLRKNLLSPTRLYPQFHIIRHLPNLIHLLRAFSLFQKQLPGGVCKKGVLRNFAKFRGKHLSRKLFFKKVAGLACNCIKKESLTQMFSCEFCEISKNTFFYRTPQVAASRFKFCSS